MSYTAEIVKDLSTSTPTEGSTLPSELNDAIREIKTVLKGLYGYVEKSANATLLVTETYVVCAGQSEAITLTLPAAASSATSSFGKTFFIRNYGTFIVTVDGNSSETIDGSTTLVLRPGTGCILICNGTGWYSFRPQPRFRGCKVTNSADFTITGGTPITWDTESYDTDSIHSTSSNTERLTVPVGVTYAKFSAEICLEGIEYDDIISVEIWKNNTSRVACTKIGSTGVTSSWSDDTCIQCTTGVIAVTAGDYYVCRCVNSNTGESDDSWFAMEIVE